MFVIGFLSDKNYLSSPTKRLFLQFITVFLFIYVSQNFVNSLRLSAIDILLGNIYFKYFMTIFCFMVLINGSNFMDGVNTLLLGYYLGVSILSLIVLNKYGSKLDIINFNIIIIILFILFYLIFLINYFLVIVGRILISFLIGYYLIYISNLSEVISPFFCRMFIMVPSV